MSEQNECETEGHPIQNETFYSEENLHARLMKSRTYLACPSVHMLIFEVINIFSLCCYATFKRRLGKHKWMA